MNYKKIGEETVEYARGHIKKGNTELALPSNVNYSSELYSSPKLLHDTVNSGVKDIRDLTDEAIKTKDPAALDIFPAVQVFDAELAIPKKYSLGNCAELAWLALDYLIEHHPDVNAELFMIAGGDHVFVVIGRDPQNLSMDPTKWSNAYIVDPWSQKVFKAAEYFDKLQNFYYSSQGIPQVESLQPHHRLVPIESMNSAHLGKRNNSTYIDSLINTYAIKIHIIEETIRAFIQALDALKIKFKDSSNAQTLITKKIADAHALLNWLKTFAADIDNLSKHKKTYRQVKDLLYSNLTTVIETVKQLEKIQNNSENTFFSKIIFGETISDFQTKMEQLLIPCNELIEKSEYKNTSTTKTKQKEPERIESVDAESTTSTSTKHNQDPVTYYQSLMASSQNKPDRSEYDTKARSTFFESKLSLDDQAEQYAQNQIYKSKETLFSIIATIQEVLNELLEDKHNQKLKSQLANVNKALDRAQQGFETAFKEAKGIVGNIDHTILEKVKEDCGLEVLSILKEHKNYAKLSEQIEKLITLSERKNFKL